MQTSKKTKLAAQAQRHRLYERAVQDPAQSIELIETIFRSKHDRLPLALREEFCGTALLCAQWVKSNPARRATGVDLDSETLKWGERHNLVRLGDTRLRVQLLAADVREDHGEGFDVVCSFNFSYSVFQKRQDLVRAFESAHRGLSPGGVLILDVQGGPEAQYTLTEETDHGDFEFQWEQEEFDPINSRHVCHIHFRFPDGSRIERAYTYDWRLWTPPELRDALIEAGFRAVEVWWDNEDGELRSMDEGVNTVSWIAYLAAWR